MSTMFRYLLLLVSFLVYSLTGVFTKFASRQVFLSWRYFLLLGGAICVMGVYAVFWQQIIRRMPVSDAFMWKGTTIVWTMVLVKELLPRKDTTRRWPSVRQKASSHQTPDLVVLNFSASRTVRNKLTLFGHAVSMLCYGSSE